MPPTQFLLSQVVQTQGLGLHVEFQRHVDLPEEGPLRSCGGQQHPEPPCLYLPVHSRMAQKEKEMCIGRKKFNMDPAKVHIQGRGHGSHQSGHLDGQRRGTWASPMCTAELGEEAAFWVPLQLIPQPTQHRRQLRTPQGQDFGPQLRLVSVYSTALQLQNGRL